jgi:hypothetical protein
MACGTPAVGHKSTPRTCRGPWDFRARAIRLWSNTQKPLSVASLAYPLLLVRGKNLVPQREVLPCTYPALHGIPHLNLSRSPLFWKTPGYCWPTPKCRNSCDPHAFFEGKKAGETSSRKSTPRTLKPGRLRASSFRPFLPAPHRTGLDTCRIIRLSGFLVSLTLAYWNLAAVLDNVQERFGGSHLAYLDVLSMGNLPHFALGLL